MVRLKNRYLLVDVTWKDNKIDDSITEQVLLLALRDAVAQNFGDFGLGSSLPSLQVKYYSPFTDVAVVRCATSEHERVLASLALMTEVRQRTATVRVVRVAGTLAMCRAAATAHSAAKLARARLGKQQLATAQKLHQQIATLEL